MGRKKMWIGELRYHVEKAMREELKMAQGTIKSLTSGFKSIEKYLIKVNYGYYTPQIVEKFIAEKIDDYHNENFSHKKLSVLRKASEYLRQYYENEILEYLRLPTLGHVNLNAYFEFAVQKYAEVEKQRGVIAPHVIEARKKTISNFLYFLQNKRHMTFSSVEPDDIRSYLFDLSQRQPKGIVSTLPIIRKFCIMLNDGIKHQMSEDNAEMFMKKYGQKARERCNEIPERVHPHQLRHTRAIHLYRSGMPLPFISELLGHVNLTTTNIYAYADTEMKRKALEKAALSTAPAIFNQNASWENDEDMILKLSGLR